MTQDSSITDLEKEIEQLQNLLDNPPPIADEIHVQMFYAGYDETGYELDIRLYHDPDHNEEYPWIVDTDYECTEESETLNEAYESFLGILHFFGIDLLIERQEKLKYKNNQTPVLLQLTNSQKRYYSLIGMGETRYEQAEKHFGTNDYRDIYLRSLFETTLELAVIKYGIKPDHLPRNESEFTENLPSD